MIISHKHKFIFIHLHKCAGTSITKSLQPYLRQQSLFLKKDIIMGCTPKHEELSNKSRKSGSIYKHSMAGEIKSFIGKALWEDYFVFAFVRNPWDLVLSKYYWWHKTDAKWNDDAQKEKQKIMSMSFTEFARTIQGSYNQTMSYSLSTEKIQEDSTEPCEKINLNFIGKFENLQEDFFKVCDALKLPRIHLPNANPSFELRNGKNYTHFYTEESRDIIADVYKKDIELFGYSFGN